MIINIALDYSETPGARYIDGGPYSGEDFRDNYLEPRYLECLTKNEKLTINFDGGYGYSTGFLEETFGGMIRKGYNAQEMLSKIEFISLEEPELVPTIISYILDEEERLSKTKKI